MEVEGCLYRGKEMRLLGEAKREGSKLLGEAKPKGSSFLKKLDQRGQTTLKPSKGGKNHLKWTKNKDKPSGSGSGAKQLA